ncbi:MAG: GNAT family N-acetyltransferase [Chloroflexota bacterium]
MLWLQLRPRLHYSPEAVKEYLRSGLVISYVAATPDGEIVGHVALARERPEDSVGDMGQAVVDPRYRGRGLLEELSVCVVKKAREDGLAGAFAEAVTAHPYSQKSARFLGFHETGVLLGFIPTTMIFRKIEDQEAPRRGSIILFYMVFNERPEAPVYPPLHHERIIRRIYENAGIQRSFLSAGSIGQPHALPSRSRIDTRVQTGLNSARLRVLEYGSDLETAVRVRLRMLCNHRIDCIYTDLPLDSPAVGPACVSLEKLGFFFGGIIPETPAGDILRLQYLNDVETDPADSQTASEFSRELMDYVMKARPS